MTKKTSLCFFIVLLVFADQWSKNLIAKAMMPGESLPILKDIFHITYVKNTGAAFSILQGKTTFLIIATAVALIGVSIYFLKYLKTNPFILSLALSMVIGGGIGNVIDRFRLGYVVDFFDFRVFPVFNVADIFVTVGCCFLILYLIIMEKNNGKKTDQN